MTKSDPLTEEKKTLLTVVAEAAARKIIAKKAGIKSGALPLLAAIAFRRYQGHNTRPQQLYAGAVCNEKLARSYIKQLIGAGLVHLQIVRDCRWLSPTLAGLGVAGNYAREIRNRGKDFAQL